MFNFLKKNKNRISKEEEFWNYFLKNKKSLEEFINSDLSDYTSFNKLTDNIRKYSSLLFSEITQNEKGKFVLIITPDGNPDGIPDATKLFESKPEIENWVVEKFRQPKDSLQFEYDGLKYPSSDIEILLEVDNEREKVNLQVFIRNMDLDKEKYQTMAWLYLDNILGEYNSITKIGYIDFYNLENEKKVKDGISILELRESMDKEIYKAEK